jgi:hypothetical protein
VTVLNLNRVVNSDINSEFIANLQKDISKALAKKINLKNTSDKYDLNYCFKLDLYLKLAEYKNILKRISNCDSCFKDYNISDIVSSIKNNLNKI